MPEEDEEEGRPVEVVIEDARWEALGLDRLARQAATATLRDAGLDPAACEIAVLGCDDARIAALNGAFRGREAPTNVLAWPSEARDPARPPEGGALGDVALSFDTCAAEARAQGKRLEDHATHLVVHATLHLLGHDHEDDGAAALMEGRERAILRGMGLPDPYAPADATDDGPRATRAPRVAPLPMSQPPEPQPPEMTQDPSGEREAAADAPPPPAEEDDSRSGLVGRILAAFVPEPAAPPPSPQTGGLQALRRMRVEDVAIPKVEIEAVPVDTSLPDLVERFRRTANTRMPVFDGTLDTPIGLVHLKDIALAFGFEGGEGKRPFDLRENIRPLLYAPPSMPIGVLLAKMQADRTHMALVIDEYGGVDGLVTLEDLIEQVIGEIEDEHDIAEGRFWVEEKPGVYLAQSRAPLDQFEAAIGRSLTPVGAEEEPDTLGGLVFVLTGRVPARGEVIPHPAGGEIEVVDADPRRIKRLRLRLPPEGAAPPEARAAE